MLVIAGEYLDKQSERAQGILRLHYLRYLLQLPNDLVIHRSLLHGNTDIDTELVAERFRVNMIT